MTEDLQHLPDVAAGLALEAELLSAPQTRTGVWTSARPALVCPAAYRNRPGFADAAEQAAAGGWPVHLRPTGGGTVPQGPGVLNLALAFTARKGFTIEDGYRLITQIIPEALGSDAPPMLPGATEGSFCDGAWNLSIDGRKLVGTAQRLRPAGGGRMRILAHALILIDGDLGPGAEAVGRFHGALGLPPIRTRAHTTLTEAMGAAAPTPETFAAALIRVATQAIAPHLAQPET